MSEWTGYNLLSKKELAKVQEQMPKFCEGMRKEKSEAQKQGFLSGVKAWVLWVALCEGQKVQGEHIILADDSPAGRRYKNVMENIKTSQVNFCRGAVQQNNLYGAYSKYLESVDSIGKEIFCITAENIGRPGMEGFKQALDTILGVTKVPSLVGLRETAKKLCIALKLGDIDVRKAWITLENERRFAEPSIGQEIAETVQDTIWDWITWPFVALASILGVIATTVGIYKALNR